MLANSEKKFITLEDPRADEKVLYPLSEILFLATGWYFLIRRFK